MLILTSCSSTKRARVRPELTANTIRERRLVPFAREWARRINAAPTVARAADLYGGPGVAAALAAARRLNCSAYFVSAGLSLLPEGRLIPAYDLSVAGTESCPPALATGEASPAQWWKALNAELGRDRPIASLIRRTDDLVLMALPASYLAMVAEDLASLTAFQLAKLRLIVSETTTVPARLDSCVVRYSGRLAGVKGAPKGANAYFPQRALGHFADLLLRHRLKDADIATQRAQVAIELAGAEPVVTPKRRLQTDAQIIRWMNENNSRSTRSATALLSEFRSAGFACEQTRFRELFGQNRKPL